MPSDNGVQVSVAKSVRVPRHDEPDKTAFEITCEDGLVSFRRISTAPGVRCTHEDLAKAVELVK